MINVNPRVKTITYWLMWLAMLITMAIITTLIWAGILSPKHIPTWLSVVTGMCNAVVCNYTISFVHPKLFSTTGGKIVKWHLGHSGGKKNESKDS